MLEKEDLILNALQNLANTVSDIRKDTEQVKLAIIRLETQLTDHRGFCRETHERIDQRMTTLDDFREDTGSHNLAEMKEKAEKEERESNNWRIWAIRGVYMLGVGLVSSTVTGCIIFYMTHGSK